MAMLLRLEVVRYHPHVGPLLAKQTGSQALSLEMESPILPTSRKRAEYCFESTVSERRTH